VVIFYFLQVKFSTGYFLSFIRKSIKKERNKLSELLINLAQLASNHKPTIKQKSAKLFIYFMFTNDLFVEH